MTRTALGLLLGAALLGGVAFVLFTLSGRATKAERQADSTLATVPAWQDSIKQRDSVQAVTDSQAADLRQQLRMQAHVVALAKHRADSLQARVDTLSHIEPGSASDSVQQLLTIVDGQKRAAVQFQITVGALDFQHGLDSLALAKADGTLAQERRWRAEDQRRIDRLTKNLGDLRNQTKHAGKFLGFLPSWTDEVLLAAGGIYLGTQLSTRH